MFNTKVVGSANAIAAGWGNMGGGVTHFLMPLIWQGISRSTPAFVAWRWAFFVPASCHVLMGIAIMLLAQVRGHTRILSRCAKTGRQAALLCYLRATNCPHDLVAAAAAAPTVS